MKTAMKQSPMLSKNPSFTTRERSWKGISNKIKTVIRYFWKKQTVIFKRRFLKKEKHRWSTYQVVHRQGPEFLSGSAPSHPSWTEPLLQRGLLAPQGTTGAKSLSEYQSLDSMFSVCVFSNCVCLFFVHVSQRVELEFTTSEMFSFPLLSPGMTQWSEELHLLQHHRQSLQAHYHTQLAAKQQRFHSL